MLMFYTHVSQDYVHDAAKYSENIYRVNKIQIE